MLKHVKTSIEGMNRKALSAAGIMLQNIIAIVDEKKTSVLFKVP